MTEPQRPLLTTNMGASSADINRVGRLAGRAAIDTQIGGIGGVDIISTTPPDVVREGLLATPGAGMQVLISAGELLRWNSGTALTADNSRYEVGRTYASTAVAIAASDPTNGRIDAIYAAVSTADVDSTSRNVMTNPTTSRIIAPQLVNTTRRPNLTLTAVTGTPGATPAFPSIPPNTVLLWYVYVPPAAAAITDAYLMDARRYARPNSVRDVGNSSRGTLCAQPGSTLNTNVRIPSGVAEVFGGGLAIVDSPFEVAIANAIQNGEGLPAADVEMDVYLITRGNGVPVGKAESNGCVVSITGLASAAPPGQSGIPPGGGIAYYPLFSQGIYSVISTTTRAAYVGSMATGSTAGTIDGIGGGLHLDRGGRKFASALASDGRFPVASGFVRAPVLRYVSATQVAIDGYGAVINRVPTFAQATVTFDISSGSIRIGAETASTWYYCYLRAARPSTGAGSSRSPVRRLIPKISAVAPDDYGRLPSPEASYTADEYLFVGSFYNDSSSDILPFFRMGNEVRFQSRASGATHIYNADLAVAAAFTTIAALAPVTAKYAMIAVDAQLSVTSGQGSVQYGFFHETGIATAAYFPVQTCGVGGGNAAVDHQHYEATMALNVANASFRGQRLALSGTGAAFNADIFSVGYIEDLNTLPN